MQFTTMTALLAATAVVSALPTDQSKQQQQGGLECYQGPGGDWNWGSSNNEQDQNYNCQSSGLLVCADIKVARKSKTDSLQNILTCVSVLDGSNTAIPIDILGNGLL
jgi:hypothetical protein